MSKEFTIAMIKPDAVEANIYDLIIDRILKEGFEISKMVEIHLTKEQAADFYSVHREKPFFPRLVEFTASGPLIAMLIRRENAVTHWRKVMGATDPIQAEEGTLRKLYGGKIPRNAVHGSDSEENAQREYEWFFEKAG